MNFESIASKIKIQKEFYQLLNDKYEIISESIYEEDNKIHIESILSIDVKKKSNRFIWKMITKLTNVNIFQINIHLLLIPNLNKIQYKFFTNEKEISFTGTILLAHHGDIIDNNIMLHQIQPKFRCITGKLEKNIVTQMNQDIISIFNKLK